MIDNKKTFTFRLDNELHEKVQILAKEDRRSMNSYIEYLIAQHIANIEEKRGPIISHADKSK